MKAFRNGQGGYLKLSGGEPPGNLLSVRKYPFDPHARS